MAPNLLLALLPFCTFFAEDPDYSSPAFGFQWSKPAGDWTQVVQKNDAAGSLTVIFRAPGNPGTIQIYVQASMPDTRLSAEVIRKEGLKSVEKKEGYSNLDSYSLEMAGRDTPAIRTDLVSQGAEYHIRQCYLVEGDFRYVVTWHAPAKEFQEYESVFQKTLESFKLIPVTAEAGAGHEISRLARKCGTEIKWHTDWYRAAKLARMQKKLVLVYCRYIPGFNISDETMVGAFMDPDIVALIEKRFIPLRFAKGSKAPFVEQDSSYGMSASTFGTSVLLATPEGEIVADNFVQAPIALDDFLRRSLQGNARFVGNPAPSGQSDYEKALWHYQRGELEEATARLGKPEDAREHVLRTRIHRRLRQGEDAQNVLAAARELPDRGDWADDLLLEEALVQLRLGSFQKGLKSLDRLRTQFASSERIPEALYWTATAYSRLENPERAEEIWKLAIEKHPESRWAWRSAGRMTGTGHKMGLPVELLKWPAERGLEALHIPPTEPLPLPKARQAEADAITYLLKQQAADGSWISPSEEIGRDYARFPFEFTEAVTAICAQGLLPYRDHPGVGEAVRKALAFLVAEEKRRPTLDQRAFFMDYRVWSRAYVLWFFADCLEEGLAKKEELAPYMEEMVQTLRSKQKDGGGWSYYLTPDLDNEGGAGNQSISFTTAAILISLIEAREAGITIPEGMIENATRCLKNAHVGDSVFAYFVYHDQNDRPMSFSAPGAAGRAPLCAYALHRAGAMGPKGVRTGLDLFLTHRLSYLKEHRKTMMHAGPDGQGSHYPMFDYSFVAAAIGVLPEGERKKYRDTLLGQMLQVRCADGSYIDNPLNGSHYGTGMALAVFQGLLK